MIVYREYMSLKFLELWWSHLQRVVVVFILASLMGLRASHAQDARYIITFKDDTTTFDRQAHSLIDYAVQDIDRIPVERSVVARMQFDQAVRVANRLDVVGMELDQRVYAFGSTNDPYLSSQGGLFGEYSAHVTDAWDITSGARNTVVAVIDSGASLNHPDLRANLWRNRKERAGNNRDDDGNGCVDDIYGCDFVNRDGDPSDDNGHGTHVSGIVAAVGDNGIGVAGVAYSSRIVPVKVLDEGGGGFVSTVIKGIDYVTSLKRRGVPIVAINLSLGGSTNSSALQRAIERARNYDILVVAAAGNESSNNDTSPLYPANLPLENILSVAAVTSSGLLSSFSNYGVSSVHLAAPGSSILSLGNSGYRVLSGTSMAAPHVAGVAALIKSAQPGLTMTQVRSIIVESVQNVPSLVGLISTSGIVDADAAVQSARATEPLSRIYGVVISARGSVLRQSLVSLKALDDPSELVQSMRTAKDGSYSFSNLSNGRYLVRVRKRSHRFSTRRVVLKDARTVRRNIRARN
jgi:serine protease